MNFIGSGQTLSGEDYARVADMLGCEEAKVRAVTFVEARGQGFDAKKRPIILPERHVFYRNLKDEPRQRAVNQGLAYSTWQPGRYPATQDGRYDLLDRMILVDEDAGLKAASWGLGQVLGENHKVCGFATAKALVDKCLESEGGQLDVMAGFIAGNNLARHLRSGNWAAFAEAYNGKSYKVNQYDVKLARAHQRFSAGISTAYDPLADGLLSVGDKGEVIKALQRALGIYADGDYGQITEQAVRDFQREHGLTIDGKVGKQTGKMLGLGYWGD